MLIIGDQNCIPDTSKGDYIIYNLFSSIVGYPELDILPPANIIDYGAENFDYLYANYIFSNDAIFYNFFTNIMYPLYSGFNVFIIADRNIVYDTICESILKLVQQRYGYNGAIINELEDIEYLDKDESFNVNGIYNLDQDKERWSYIYASLNSYRAPDGSIKIRGFEGKKHD